RLLDVFLSHGGRSFGSARQRSRHAAPVPRAGLSTRAADILRLVRLHGDWHGLLRCLEVTNWAGHLVCRLTALLHSEEAEGAQDGAGSAAGLEVTVSRLRRNLRTRPPRKSVRRLPAAGR